MSHFARSAARPLLLGLPILLSACSGAPEPVPKAAEPPKPAAPAGPTFDYSADAAKLNVILISMDALRFDRTGPGGGKDTPNLDAFSKEAVVFSHVTSAAPWTLPSHLAMFTARWPTLHGVTNKLKPNPAGGEAVFTRLDDAIPTYPEELTKKGWEAVAFTGGAGVSGKFGYNRGFTSYLDDKAFAGMDYSGPPAAEWLKAHATGHFFMFFHGYDAHGQHPLVDQDPRAAVPDYKGKLDGSIEEQAKLREQGLAEIKKPGDPARLDGVDAEDARFLLEVYDAKVKEADARLGTFLATVKELGLLDTSIIMVVGDHGDEFMEHGYVDHGATLCDHQLHVPMIIRFPHGDGARVVEDNVRTVDLFPTVFDALGVAGPEGVNGQSLIPMLQGEKMVLPIYAESDYRLFVHLRSVREGQKKLILDLEDGQHSLFDLASDRDELTDLSATDARTTYEMEQNVRTWLNGMKSDPKAYLGLEEESIKLF